MRIFENGIYRDTEENEFDTVIGFDETPEYPDELELLAQAVQELISMVLGE